MTIRHQYSGNRKKCQAGNDRSERCSQKFKGAANARLVPARLVAAQPKDRAMDSCPKKLAGAKLFSRIRRNKPHAKSENIFFVGFAS